MELKSTSFSKSDRPVSGVVKGAVHAELEGARDSHRYRPTRVHNESLSSPIECSFLLEDEVKPTMARVIDVSATGLALEPNAPGVIDTRGTKLSHLVISHRDETLFEGSGVVVYQTDGRIGVRTNGLIDLRSVQVRETLEGGGLLHSLSMLSAQFETLEPAWRAAVADLASLFQTVRAALDEIEAGMSGSELEDPESQSRFLRHILEEWSDVHLDKLRLLHRLSRDFDERQMELGRAYAEMLLAPLYLHGALYYRATTKPRGYAGDYLTMLLFSQQEPVGDTLFGKFVDLASKEHSLCTTALTRQASVTERVLDCIQRGGKKIVSLASGPAIELGAVIDRLDEHSQIVEFILIDQDEEALAYSHDFLLKKVLERGLDPFKIRINCIHFSVKQILKPKTKAEMEILEQVLRGSDFIYSVGLLDYLPDPVASRLIGALYGLLGHGGQLFIGNLVEAEDATWLMDFVLAWHLVWRTPASMEALPTDLEPTPQLTRVEMDATEKCLFLEIHAP